MSKKTLQLLESILRLNDNDKRRCIKYLEEAQKELQEEIQRLKKPLTK